MVHVGKSDLHVASIDFDDCIHLAIASADIRHVGPDQATKS